MHAIGSMSQQRHLLDTKLGMFMDDRLPSVDLDRTRNEQRQCHFSLVTPRSCQAPILRL
jgi:hypothetical protein